MRKKCFFSAVFSLMMIFALIPFTAFAKDERDNYAKDERGNYAQGWGGHPERSCVYDGPDFFTDGTESELNAIIQEASEELELNILVFIADPRYYMSDSETKLYADRIYEETFGADTDGLVYFMDFTGKKPAYDYISTSGKAIVYYKSHINSIFSALDRYLPPSSVSDYSLYTNDIKKAIECFVKELRTYSTNKLAYYFDPSTGHYIYYKHGELRIDSHKPFLVRLRALIFALPIGIIAAFVFYFATKSSYRFKGSTNAVVYLDGSSRFSRRDDHFVRTYTSKHKIDSGGSGSHHSSHRSSSHHGSHGGGGHHR